MPLFRSLSSRLKRRHSTPGHGSHASDAMPAVHEVDHPSVVNEDHTIQPEASNTTTSADHQGDEHTLAQYSSNTVTAPTSATPYTQNDSHPPNRSDVERVFQEWAQLIHASLRPLPIQSGDGQYFGNEEQDPGTLADLRTLGPNDLKSALNILEAKASGKPQDDRKLLQEQVIRIISDLPAHSAQRMNLTRLLQGEIWNSLEHPPLTYLGDQFRYRSADGSNNSYLYPKLGAANTPYARSIDPVTVQPGARPDPGLLFDSLLAREHFKPHPNNISSIFFNWASLIIHGRP